ncbi:MAG: serine/threonine-protein kinase [Lysobacteraceae bacterium]
MTTSRVQWQELDQELDRLLDLEPVARAMRLKALEGEHPLRAARLRRLLGGLSLSEGLDGLASSPLHADALAALPDELHPGQQLGTWTLLRRIGQGGMADVFEAERRLEQARQRAAIKVMSVGLRGSELRRRFQQETAILARLDDPRLSRLIDAGATEDGRPWLAMEFVDGEPIDQACDRLGLGVEARVALVVDVAMALAHAHRQLVIHRDLKPANILLDAQGKVRVLDFGIARIVEDEGVNPALTATRTQAYTPAWASPEQLSGEPAGVASDVYQLGLLLFALLTGHRAFDDAGIDPLRLLAAMRDGASPPSRRLAGSTAADTRFPPAGQDRRRWGRRLRGDLDSIVLRALEPRPESRYGSAREFADDLRRWRDGMPIRARPASRRYLASRWLKRHWIGAIASAAILLLLAGYALTATWQGRRLVEERNAAEHARSRAEAMHGFLLRLIGSGDPQDAENHGRDIGELLVEGVEEARRDFANQPLLLAQLLADMGGVLLNRSRESEAESALSEALAIREAQLGATHADTLAARLQLADTRFRLGQWSAARELLLTQLELAMQAGDPDAWRIPALRLLGAVESSAGDIQAAESRLDQALALLSQRMPVDDENPRLQRAELEAQLATILLRDNRFEASLPILRSALGEHLEQFGATDQRTLSVRTNLAYALRMERQPDAAESELREVLAAQRSLHDAPHRDIATTLGHLANLASDRKDYDGAVATWREARAEAVAALGAEHPWIDMLDFPIARSLLRGGHREEAAAILRRLALLEAREDGLHEKALQMLADNDLTP